MGRTTHIRCSRLSPSPSREQSAKPVGGERPTTSLALGEHQAKTSAWIRSLKAPF